jgi:SAM-dependent methyltransferase
MWHNGLVIEGEMTERQIKALFSARHEYEGRSPWLEKELEEKDRLFNIPVKGFLTKELEDIGGEKEILDVGSGIFADNYLPNNRIKQTTKTDFVEIDNNDQNIINVNADDLLSVFDEESFGVVIMKQVYTHLKNPIKSLEETNKVLKRGGLFFLIDWEKVDGAKDQREISDYVPEMVTKFKADEMMEKIKQFGFEPIKKEILLRKSAFSVPYEVLLTAVVGKKI